jgi:hypothetical protein
MKFDCDTFYHFTRRCQHIITWNFREKSLHVDVRVCRSILFVTLVMLTQPLRVSVYVLHFWDHVVECASFGALPSILLLHVLR